MEKEKGELEQVFRNVARSLNRLREEKDEERRRRREKVRVDDAPSVRIKETSCRGSDLNPTQDHT